MTGRFWEPRMKHGSNTDRGRTGVKVGLLINFGRAKVEVKRMVF